MKRAWNGRGGERVGARRGAGRSQGITLPELMIAMAVMSFGMMTMAYAQLHAIKQSAQGNHTSDGASIARVHLEHVQRLPWTTLDGAQVIGTWTNPTWPYSSATSSMWLAKPGGGAGNQQYAVQWRVADVAGNACLRDVDVQVTWSEQSTGQSKTSTLSTRRYNWGGSGC